MRLRGVKRSSNVSDRRRRRSAGGTAGLGGIGLIAVLLIGAFLGVDVTPLLQDDQVSQSPSETRDLSQEEVAAGDFAARVLTTTEVVWGEIFPAQLGAAYRPPELILFSGATQSGCGGASASTGPFYCPADRRAYLDTAFFATLSRELGARGDFAAAYVIAHEVAHHVQNEMGILPQVMELRARSSPTQSNQLSVRTELMADCLSGIWAAGVEDLLEPGDIEEAVNAARRIGDDYLAQRAGRAANPHTFTHGTSEQRARWFARGFQQRQVAGCDTFSTDRL
ncbi:MAG: neutral zinc metallopeptidase [Pseudomonadota bacterium]